MNFSPQNYLEHILEELIHEFKGSSLSATPGLIGQTKEIPARQKLELILPRAAAVGSGIVIDSYGDLSKQQDIVIYEQAFCPVYNINNTPESTYYPCEGVIAVGEVKTTLNTSEIEDSFKKIASAKSLKRKLVASKSILTGEETVDYRNYGSLNCFEATKDKELSPSTKAHDQIYGFILCEKFGLKEKNMMKKIRQEFQKYENAICPNLIISLQDGCYQLAKNNGRMVCFSAMDASHILYSNDNKLGFRTLIHRLSTAITSGRTTELNRYKEYISDNGNLNFIPTLIETL